MPRAVMCLRRADCLWCTLRIRLPRQIREWLQVLRPDPTDRLRRVRSTLNPLPVVVRWALQRLRTVIVFRHLTARASRTLRPLMLVNRLATELFTDLMSAASLQTLGESLFPNYWRRAAAVKSAPLRTASNERLDRLPSRRRRVRT